MPISYNTAKKKAQELLSKLTLEQKIGQLSQYGESIYTNGETTYRELYREGKVGSYLGITKKPDIQKIQEEMKEDAPYEIPALMALDVIHGHRTLFPAPIGQSCSFNPEMTGRACAVQAKEAYDDGIRWTFSPMCDVSRDARWGRIMESFGEDPYLVSCFVKAAVHGYQGDKVGEEGHVLACLKHFCGYGACEAGADYNGIRISREDLMDLYMPPFEAGVQAGAATVMSAFHDVNGVPATGNRWLLKDILRTRLGFKGFVVSDYSAIEELVNHGYAQDQKDAALKAFKAGVNMHMAGGLYNQYIKEFVEDGTIAEEEIDEYVLPVLTYKYLIGFDHVLPTDAPQEISETSRALAREAARGTIVLLKQDDAVLPLKDVKRIAVIGPAADHAMSYYSSWTLIRHEEDGVSLLSALREQYPSAKIEFEHGCDYDSCDQSHFKKALAIAKKADVILFACGEPLEYSGEAKSRTSLELPGVQLELLKLLATAKKPLVSIVTTGRPLVMEQVADYSRALLYAWLPGIEGGHAIVDVLSGAYNPSGRLSVSLPIASGATPCAYNRNASGRPYEPKGHYKLGYIDNNMESSFLFGYGLSYTTYEYGAVSLNQVEYQKEDTITVSCDVTNTGSFAGKETVQVYIRDLVASRVRPIRQLKGFTQVELQPGETKKVQIQIPVSSLAFTNDQLEKVIEPGTFKLWCGASCRDDARAITFEVV